MKIARAHLMDLTAWIWILAVIFGWLLQFGEILPRVARMFGLAGG